MAMGMFAVAMSGGMFGIRKGFDFVENARNYTVASQILQSEVESLRILTWPEIEELGRESVVPLDQRFDEEIAKKFTLTRKMTITGVQKKEVEVTLTWKNSAGGDEAVTFSTFITEGGINDYYQRTI